VNAGRSLLGGSATLDTIVSPLAWMVAIVVVFVPLAVRTYRRL
jgi:hypothetical protein